MNDFNQLVAASLALLLCLASFFAVMSVFFASRIQKAQDMLEQALGRSFTIGLVNFLFFGAIALGFGSIPESFLGGLPRLLALLFLTVPALGTIIGLSAMVEIVGRRLIPRTQGLSRTGIGAVVLSLACALPFVGWFAMLPFVLLSSLGAFILTLFSPKHPTIDDAG